MIIDNEELKIMREAKREWARKLQERQAYRRKMVEMLGKDPREDLEMRLLSTFYDQVNYEIKAINDELKRRAETAFTRPAARVHLKQNDDRESIERMMRGNYNKYGGEDI